MRPQKRAQVAVIPPEIENNTPPQASMPAGLREKRLILFHRHRY